MAWIINCKQAYCADPVIKVLLADSLSQALLDLRAYAKKNHKELTPLLWTQVPLEEAERYCRERSQNEGVDFRGIV